MADQQGASARYAARETAIAHCFRAADMRRYLES